MSDPARLADLLRRFEEFKAQGSSPTPEQMCHDCPELLPQFLRLLQPATLDLAPAASGQSSNGRREANAEGRGEQTLSLLPAPVTPPPVHDPSAAETVDAGGPHRPSPGDETQDVVPSRPVGKAPQAIPGYDILGKLGQGGMGVVYKARHRGLNRLVALKMVLAGEHARPEELIRFQQEAEAVARLQHPNIVAVYDVGRCEDCPYFTMELVEGGSLSQRLAGRPQSAGDAAAIVEKLARAMHAAHQSGIIHRDLKPGNVLLQIDNPSEKSAICNLQSTIPKITDFGLAKRLDDDTGLTQSGMPLGTPGYMAPEQAAGNVKECGHLADVYSLGAILYEMLTGRPPFRAETTLQTLLQVQNDEPVPPSKLNSRVPRDLETICLKCLQKAPGKRYGTAAALADDLARFSAGETILARPVGALEKAWRWCRRKPAQAGLIATIATLFVFSVAAGFWYVNDRAEQRTDQLRKTLVQEQRRAVARQKISDALGQAQRARSEYTQALAVPGGVFVKLSEKDNWQSKIVIARAAVDRARALTQDLASQDQGESSLPTAAEDLTLVAEVDNSIRLLEHDESERQLAVRLENIRKERATRFEGNPHQKGYEDYAGAGLAVFAGDAAAAGARIAAQAIKEQLVAALDDWAYAAWRSGKLEEMKHLLAVARAAAPDPVGDRLRRFETFTQPGEFDKIFKELTPTALSPQLLILVSKLIPEGHADREAWARKAQRKYPNDFWLNLYLADVMEKAHPADAIGYLRAAIAVRPDNFAAHFNLGWALERDRRPLEAIEEFEQAIACNPMSGRLQYKLAQALEGQGRVKDAVAALRKVSDLAEQDRKRHRDLGAMANKRIGFIANNLKQPIEAEAAFRKALFFDPEATSYYNLGVALEAQGRRPEAIAAFASSIKSKPDYAMARNNLGVLMIRQNRLEDAAEHLGWVVKSDPKFPAAHANLGVVKLKLKHFVEAAANLEIAAELDPRNVGILFNLGLAYRLQGELSRVVPPLEKCLALDARYAQAYNLLGEALFNLGFFERAEAIGLKALKELPKHPGRDGIEALIADCRTQSGQDRIQQAALAGEKMPPALLLSFAQRGRSFHRHAVAVGLYQLTFKAEPSLAVDHRFQAALSAVLAARDDDKDRPAMLRLARDWLSADLDFCTLLLEKGTREQRQLARQRLQQLSVHPDLTAVRDGKLLAMLPEAERQAWRKLWSSAAELLKKGE